LFLEFLTRYFEEKIIMKNTPSLRNLTGIAFFSFLSAFFCFQTSAQTPVLQLTTSNYNGYNIDCFGSNSGSINLTITGGTPPYTIRWSNDVTTEDQSGLPAGYYVVEVDDSDSLTDVVLKISC